MWKIFKFAVNLAFISLSLLQTSSLLAQEPQGKLVFTFDYDVYTYQFGAAEPIRITNGAISGETSWSPDGSKIAYVSFLNNQSDIYIMNADGTSSTPITADALTESAITWSPDGNYIAFISGRSGNTEIYVMDIDGQNTHNVSNNRSRNFDPSWSPDSQKLLFSSERNGNYDIYVVNRDGSNPQSLINTPEVEQLPIWSSDGKRIAYLSGGGCDVIYKANSDGSNPVAVSDEICDLGQIEWLPGTYDLLYLKNSTLFRLNKDLSVEQLIILPTDIRKSVYQFDYWEGDTSNASSLATSSPTVEVTATN